MTISKGFWISQTPVTVGAYRVFTAATQHPAPPSPDFQQGDDHPVVKVDWEDAQAYCKWAGGRLPTEAEWEYAARGGSEEARYRSLDEIAWYADNSGRIRLDSATLWQADPKWDTYTLKLRANGNQTHPVRGRAPNAFKLYDTLGNVWEWCSDWYKREYYETSPERDPQGPTKANVRVMRGGSWLTFPKSVRVSYRNWDRSTNQLFSVGFRCVREVIP